MATELIESFELFNTAAIAGQGDTYFNTDSAPTIQTARVRNGTRALQCFNQSCQRPVSNQSTSGVMHIATLAENLGSAILGGIRFGSGMVGTAGSLLVARGATPSTLGLYRSSQSTLLAESGPLASDIFHSCEFGIDAAGNWSFAVNGQLVGSGSTTPIGTINTLQFGCNTFNRSVHDDVFVRTGESNLLGDTVCLVADAVSNSTPQDWTVTGPSAVDVLSNVPANAAEFLEAAAVNDVSEFNMADLSANLAGVWAVGTWYKALKTSAGNGSMRTNLANNSQVSNGADNALTQQAAYYRDNFDTNPDGGGAWTPADIASLQMQLERTL